MSTEETIIWSKFLAAYGKDFQRFDYDLRVGNGITPGEPIPDLFKKDYEDLTKSRIDAVGYNGKIATIFEVKQRANLNAIGQLIGYGHLFRKSFPQFAVKDLFLICGSASYEIADILASNNIKILILT